MNGKSSRRMYGKSRQFYFSLRTNQVLSPFDVYLFDCQTTAKNEIFILRYFHILIIGVEEGRGAVC